MPAPCLDRSRLEISKLDPSSTLPAFSCGDDDLDEFLRDDAAHLQEAGVSQVYLAWYEAELVGYAAVLADAIQLKTNDVKRLRPLTYQDAQLIIPAVKLGRLAVSTAFKDRYSRCGTCLVQLVVDLAQSVTEVVGCRLLTVDAYRASIGFYSKLGFASRKLDVEDSNRKTIPMWLDLRCERTWI